MALLEMDLANGRCDAKDKRLSWKMPTSVNSLTVQLRRSPPFQDLISVLETQGIEVKTHDGSDVYSLAMLDPGSPPIDEESFQSEVLKVFQRFKWCWTRFLRSTDKKPRSVGVSNSTLQMGNFLDHGSFIAQHQMRSCSIRLDGRQIEFCLQREFYLQFWAHEMEDFVLIDLNQQWFSIFLTLRHPPRLSRGKNSSSIVEERTRISEIALEDQTTLKSASFARCKTYRLIFECKAYHPVVEYFEFLGKEVYYCKISNIPSSTEARIKDLSAMPGCHHTSSWEVNLAWLCVMSSPGFVPERFTRSFFERLNGWNERVVIRGLHWLAQMMNKDHFVNPNDHLDQFPRACAIRRQNQNLEDTSNNCRIPRLILTPTRLVFFEPEIINSNRILRNWSEKTSFLKVSVRDENLEKLSRSTGGIQVLLQSLFDQMKSGFDLIGGRKQFRFLGCSNNQVRDHGCFFVDVSSDVQMAEEIRKNCGNLDYIRNVAKYISRLGQAFSTSIKTVNLKPKECEKIPDIEFNGYIFTDGIGKISPDLAVEIAEKLEQCRTVPCAFQVRFGGCKGVLAVDMGMKDRPDGRRLAFRDSMIKYWSNDTTIEVLASYARPQELFLNQQLIMLLSNLGISDGVFIKLLKDQLKLMSEMFTNEDRARERLSSMDCGISWKELFKTQFKTTSDPYFRSLLTALYKGRIKGLREKSRIPIDPLKARVLLGTVDETSTLDYGQVFIQISRNLKDPGKDKLIVQQRVVIGKSPCLHPGDVRTFDAIDCPSLHHMCDCIVFPSRGPRPHPNELSGSDLDGDLYHVIWLEDLVPKELNKTPMMYPTIPVVEINDTVSTDHMLDFLKENIEFDCLGQINNLHKALVDQKGLESESCLKLAELHTQAVDAPKTGQWPQIHSKIKRLLKRHPDFMMKEDKPSYPSEKVLGQMYRECNKLCNTENYSPEWRNPGMILIPGIEKFEEDAKKHCADFKSALEEMMMMYGVNTEAEFMSGMVQSYHKKIGKEGTAISDILYSIKTKLIEKYRGIFLEDELIVESGSIVEEQAISKAAAWYNVCYSTSGINKEVSLSGRKNCRFLSFAWVNVEYLIKAFAKMDYQSMIIQDQIGHDIEETWFEDRPRLLPLYQDQVIAIDELNSKLVDFGYYGRLHGMCDTMLFDENEPELEVQVSWEDTRLLTEDAVYSLKTILQDQEVDCSVLNSDGIKKLHFTFYSKALTRIIKGHLTVDPALQFQSRILLEYIFNAPWLLIILRVLLKWFRSEELLGLNNNSLIDGHVVCFNFIDYCLSHKEIHPVSPGQVDIDDLEAGSDLNIWQMIIPGMDNIEKPELGSLLLSFLADYVPYKVHAELQCVLDVSYYYQYCSMETMEMLKETLYRGYHKLSFHCSLAALFSATQTEKVVYIPDSSIRRLNGTVKYLEQLVYRTTGVEVYSHKKSREGAGVLLKLSGTYMGIHAAEKLLKDFNLRDNALTKSRTNYPGNLELLTPNYYGVIIEGVSEERDFIKFKEYWGPHHPDDDNRGLYILQVPNPSESIPEAFYNCQSKKFLAFKEFFMDRWNYFKNWYDPDVHGPVKLTVKFGSFYVVSPSKELLDQPHGVCLNEIYDILDEDEQNRIPDVMEWKKFVRTKFKKRNQGKLRLEVPTKTAFFSRIHSSISGTFLREIIENYGMKEVHQRSHFSLHLKGLKHGIEAIYSSEDLELESVHYPPLKWATIDVKRHHDSPLVHDMRIEIGSQEIVREGSTSADLGRALHHRNSTIDVMTKLMPQVISLDQIFETEFKVPVGCSFWQRVKLVLSQVTRNSRPDERHHGFQKTETLYRLTLEVEVDSEESDSMSEEFITELWYQSMCLSDLLKEQQIKLC